MSADNSNYSEEEGAALWQAATPAPGELTPEEAEYGFSLPSAADIAAARKSDTDLLHIFYANGLYRFRNDVPEMRPSLDRCWSLYKDQYTVVGGRPTQRDMHPSKLGAGADKAFLFESDATKPLVADNFYYRLFGTAIATAYDRDVHHKTHDIIYSPERIARSTAINRTVLHLDRPVLVCGAFQAVRNETLTAEFLCLPLAPKTPETRQVFGVAHIAYRNTDTPFF